MPRFANLRCDLPLYQRAERTLQDRYNHFGRQEIRRIREAMPAKPCPD